MKDLFDRAALAIFAGDIGALKEAVSASDVATYRAESGHRTLLQMVACEEPHVPEPAEVAKILVEAGAATTGPLISAAGCNARDTLETMLLLGVPVDANHDKWTPLDEALYWNRSEIADLLVEKGASVDRLRRAAGLGQVKKTESFFDGLNLIDSAGPIGSPFTDTVSESEAIDPVQILNHAFVMAVNCGQKATAFQLLEHGAQINAVPAGYHWKGTALHAAVWRGNIDLVQWLLAQDADPTLKDGLADADALGWARHHGHPSIMELFE